MDRGGHPLSAILLEETECGQYAWLADEEFGPFDTRWDVARWIAKRLVATGTQPASATVRY
jgi:hypothetical protein